MPIQNDKGWSFGASFGYDRSRAEGNTDREYTILGLATYRLENDQVLHVNLGSKRTETPDGSQSNGTWGVGYEFPLMEKLQLTVETFGAWNAEQSRPDKAIGLRYEIVDGLKVSGAVGRGNDRSFGQVGFAWEF